MEDIIESTAENKEGNSKNKNVHDALQTLKNVGRGILGPILEVAGIGVMVTINPVLGVGMIILGASEFDKGAFKNMRMEGNLFAVGTYWEGIPIIGKKTENFIMMEPRSIKSVIEMFCAKKDITEMVKEHRNERLLRNDSRIMGKVSQFSMNYQMLDLFSCLEKCDKNGEKIKYTTITHKYVYDSLEKMKELGLVENLQKEPKLNERGKHKGEQKEKSLWVEKLLLGNFKDWSKKEVFYNVSFNLTDKGLTNGTAKAILSIGTEQGFATKDEFVEEFADKCNIKGNKDKSVKHISWKIEPVKRTLRAIKQIPTAIKQIPTVIKKVFGKTDENKQKKTPNLEEKSKGVEQVAQVEVDKAQAEKAKEEALRWTLRGHDPNDPNRESKYEASKAIAEQAHEENSKSPVVEELKLAREGESR